MEMTQDTLDRELFRAIRCYYKPDTQLAAIDRVRYLLDLGANPNIWVRDDREPLLLHLLMWGNGYENIPIKRTLVELLIKAGADPNCWIIFGNESDFCPARVFTPLSFVCHTKDLEIFNLLVDYGADIHQPLENNNTLLHQAAKYCNPTVCEYLLKEGFDVDAANDDNETPLHLVCMQEFTRSRNELFNFPVVIDVLLNWGAHVNIQNNKGFTALHFLARNARWPQAQQAAVRLLSHGADLRILSGRENALETSLEQVAIAPNVYRYNSKKDFKENRKLCEIMVTHQVLVNKGILTLLGCLKKMGRKGNFVAKELYRNREQWLRPYFERLYLPLEELLQKNYFGSFRRITLSDHFMRIKRCFPESNFNIDFFDPARIPETYQNLNRNIYQDLQQPKIVNLTQSNSNFSNNNNNDDNIYQMEEVIEEALTPAQNAPNSDDSDSDDDHENIWALIAARENAAQGNRQFLAENDAIEEELRVEATTYNFDLFKSVLILGIYGVIGYTIYKYYTDQKTEADNENKKKDVKKKKLVSMSATA